MTSKLDGEICEWAKDVINSSSSSGFSGINIIEKILRDPGFSTGGSRHRVHWWPRNKTIAKMSRAMHQIDPISQVCLVVDSGNLVKEDGNIFTLHDLKKSSSLSMAFIKETIRESKRKLRKIARNKAKV